MRRKALIATLCWLALSGSSAKVVQTAYGVGFIDNISAESGSRLYKDVPVGVYASATPYAAYSFHAPTLVAPKTDQVIPVKEESVIVQNSNGFLKDSYGQRFVEAPQTVAYKAIFPQQFVQLQNLPAHLSQPLVATTNIQYGQGTPHFFQQSQFRTPTLQTLAPSNIHQFTSSQPFIFGNNVRNFAPSPFTSQAQRHPSSQQQSTNNKNVYVNNLTAEQFSKLQHEPKFQRIQESPTISSAPTNHNNNNKQSQVQNGPIQHLQLVHVPKKTSVTAVTNGKKTIVNFLTKQPVPLLDLTLLEPLTFDNPLVPQVQHFLPRINNVKYKKLPELIQNTHIHNNVPEINEVKKHQMEFMVKNTKSYDSGLIKAKPKNELSKKKQNEPVHHNEETDEIEVYPTPTLTIQEDLEDNPEISYEINSPNYKETISEKKVSYNKKTESEPVSISYDKQTQSEPVHYTYEERSEKKPIHYSFTHSSKEPVKYKKVYAEINNDQPKQLIYHFDAEENNDRKPNHRHNIDTIQNKPERSSGKSSEENDREEAPSENEELDDRQEYHNEAPKPYHPRPEHREQHKEHRQQQEYIEQQPEHRKQHQSYHNNQNDESADLRKDPPRQISQKPRQNEEHFQPIVPEYEEDIRILPTHKPHAPVKLEHHQNHHQNHHSNNRHHDPEPHHDHQNYDYPKSHYTSSPEERDKSERIIIKDGTTGEVHKSNEQLLDQMVKKQEESEEDFEKAYKNAAYGFPAYDAPYVDVEREIYNPDSYGSSNYHKNYNAEKSPLRQYEADGDDYPKYTRSQYKDARDKTTDDYFLDYSISRPESLKERHKKKEDYYKVYTQHKPEKYFAKENNNNQNAKYTASSLQGYYAKPQQKQQLAKYKIVPKFEAYNYNKEAPRDNSAYATRPQQLYKIKTQFVEPQYQYGFEPLSIPRLLDSELAAVASNHNPQSERLGLRKKNQKTNWHIKNTSLKTGS